MFPTTEAVSRLLKGKALIHPEYSSLTTWTTCSFLNLAFGLLRSLLQFSPRTESQERALHDLQAGRACVYGHAFDTFVIADRLDTKRSWDSDTVYARESWLLPQAFAVYPQASHVPNRHLMNPPLLAHRLLVVLLDLQRLVVLVGRQPIQVHTWKGKSC